MHYYAYGKHGRTTHKKARPCFREEHQGKIKTHDRALIKTCPYFKEIIFPEAPKVSCPRFRPYFL